MRYGVDENNTCVECMKRVGSIFDHDLECSVGLDERKLYAQLERNSDYSKRALSGGYASDNNAPQLDRSLSKFGYSSRGNRMQHEEPLLRERQNTHGDISLNADCYDDLETVMKKYMYDQLEVNSRLRYPMAMILMKLSRIMTGDPTFPDHWDDLSGYSILAKKLCGNEAALNCVSLGQDARA